MCTLDDIPVKYSTFVLNKEADSKSSGRKIKEIAEKTQKNKCHKQEWALWDTKTYFKVLILKQCGLGTQKHGETTETD